MVRKEMDTMEKIQPNLTSYSNNSDLRKEASALVNQAIQKVIRNPQTITPSQTSQEIQKVDKSELNALAIQHIQQNGNNATGSTMQDLVNLLEQKIAQLQNNHQTHPSVRASNNEEQKQPNVVFEPKAYATQILGKGDEIGEIHIEESQQNQENQNQASQNESSPNTHGGSVSRSFSGEASVSGGGSNAGGGGGFGAAVGSASQSPPHNHNQNQTQQSQKLQSVKDKLEKAGLEQAASSIGLMDMQTGKFIPITKDSALNAPDKIGLTYVAPRGELLPGQLVVSYQHLDPSQAGELHVTPIEKEGSTTTQAVEKYREFLRKNPDSPLKGEIEARIAKLTAQQGETQVG
jgi:hypothetical protein